MKNPKHLIWALVGLLAFPLSAAERLVEIKVYPRHAELYLEGALVKPVGFSGSTGEWRSYRLDAKGGLYRFKARGYQDHWLPLDADTGRRLELRLDREASLLDLVGEFPTGPQPKSVIYTPDGRHALVAQLNGDGLDLYQTEPFKRLRKIAIPPLGKGNKLGFVEFAMLPWQDEVWVSQMTTGQVHVLRLSDFSYQSSFSTGGSWSKVICVHPDRQRAFVSNWLSQNVSLIDTKRHRLVRTLACSGVPRGMAVTPDGQGLWVAIYEPGKLDYFNLKSYAREKTLSWPMVGAKRHVVLSPDGSTMYVSDMEQGEIWAFDLKTAALLKRMPVAPKLNTFDITPDGRLLFVSSRGENNPVSYLEKGPDFGTMSVVDTRTGRKVDWAWGRNQPTGLAIHPNGHQVAFTDFLDDNLEVYDFSRLLASLDQAEGR